MFNLVLKDFLLQKKITLITIAYALFFSVVCYFNATKLDKLMVFPIFGIVFSTYLSIFYMIGKEERTKSLIIINSLPLERSQIVISKYISLIFFIIINTLVFYLPILLLGVIYANNSVSSLDYSIIIMFLSFLLILFSIYYPLYFKYGYNAMRIFSFAFYILTFTIPNFLQKLIKTNNPLLHKLINYMLVNPSKTIWITFILTVLIFIASLYASIGIYKNKDI